MKEKVSFALTTILVASFGATFLSLATDAYDPLFDQKMKDRQAKHRWKMQEFDRKFKKDFNSSSSSYPSTSGSYSSGPTSTYASTSTGASNSHAAPRRTPFDARMTPDPKLCVMKFVQVAKSATSMEQIYPYLSDSLASKMRNYDASGADPDYSRKKLIDYRRLASSVVKVNKVSWKRLQDSPPSASVYVTRRVNKKVNGHLYKDRGCDFRMVGENNYWKFESYSDSLWLHD